ncbi:MEI2-like 4, putative isoform 2 [Hibiscus syriacus]|uniref:MEI2-like 4, putative isoform 2 n=1 Tax=Hibiscus syriacus TaxID=106335 RepID=A0A6A2XJX7_HIBSY|nr:MEI2-like 4, putative isoform 2 [Hibiscus syriacus]
MPSETMDLQSLSPPCIFSDEMRFPTEVGFWKLDTVLDQRACKKSVTPSTVKEIIPVESRITRYLDNAEPFAKQHHKVNLSVDSRIVGAERVLNQSVNLSKLINRGPGTNSSYIGEEGNNVNTMASQFENSLFSSSFSEFFARKLKLSSDNALYENSIDTVASSHYEDEEPFESLEELEAQTIGNLLPDDDDLFSCVTEGLDLVVGPNGAEEAEELDVFSSVGGMDLGDDGPTVEHRHSPSNDANLAVGPNSLNNMEAGTNSGLNSYIKAPFPEPTIPHGVSSGVSNGELAFYPCPMPEYQNGSSRAVNINSKPLGRIDNKTLTRMSSTGRLFEFSNAGFRSAENGRHLLPGHHYSWSNYYNPEPPTMMWPNSPPLVNGVYAAHSTAQLHLLPTTHTLNPCVPVINYHVGSAPTVNPSLWDRRHAYGGEFPNAGFHQASLGRPWLFHSRSSMYNGRGQSIPITRSVDSPHEHARSRRNEGNINQADKKQYELDIEHIIRGEDKRTTLMLKNIPNKYTSKMLLAAIDERGGGTYDFVYLPIDFKASFLLPGNKCNVGYAFINMLEPSQVITFYQAFNGKKWGKFNSEKVASLAYARIQGKAALMAHFQNSNLMNEDKRCRPILFNSDGPNAGDQVPFPAGVIARTRPGKARSANHEENNQESPLSSENEDTCSSKGSC